MKRKLFSARCVFARLRSGIRTWRGAATDCHPQGSRNVSVGALDEKARLDDDAGNEGRLTVIMPTYNRPEHCAAQLRFFKQCGMRHAIVVADSSDPPQDERVRAACAGLAEYRHHAPNIVEKFLSAVSAAKTAFVVMVPDDDVTFPHALDAALDFLRHNPDHAVAHGYTLQFGMHERNFDVHKVCTFVPSIDQADPLERLFRHMRRYQPFFWAVYRRDVLVSALQAALPFTAVPICQELTIMNTAVVQGKVALLPMIFAMRGAEESKTIISGKHPSYACVDNAEQFFSTYAAYRNVLADFIRVRKLVSPDRKFRNPVTGAFDARLEQFIDVAHGSWLAREANVGVFNHAAEILLGGPKPLLRDGPEWPGWQEPSAGDLVHRGGGRCYVWRRSVLEAEPRDEIAITPEEIAQVEAQLEFYRLG